MGKSSENGLNNDYAELAPVMKSETADRILTRKNVGLQPKYNLI